MKTYIVVEGQSDADILRIALPPSTLHHTHLVVGGSTSSGVSLARSLISDRGEPLLLVMDADTVNQEAIIEQAQALRELLGAVAINTPYDVILAIPELEVVFFQDLEVLAQVLQLSLDHEVAINSVYEPRKTLHALCMRSPRQIDDQGQFLQLLDDTARARIAQHPILQKIKDFVVNAEALSIA
jgi:hypothetical protein